MELEGERYAAAHRAGGLHEIDGLPVLTDNGNITFRKQVAIKIVKRGMESKADGVHSLRTHQDTSFAVPASGQRPRRWTKSMPPPSRRRTRTSSTCMRV